MTLLPSDSNFWPAVGAAVVDEHRAQWTPTTDESGYLEPNHYQFTREHVQILHGCGCTRQQVLDYAAQLYTPTQVAKFATDLDSYGIWPDGD